MSSLWVLLGHYLYPHYPYNLNIQQFNRDQKKYYLQETCIYLSIHIQTKYIFWFASKAFTHQFHVIYQFTFKRKYYCYINIDFVQKQYNYETWQITDDILKYKVGKKRTYIKANIKKSVSIFDSSCIYSSTIQCMLESN